MNYSDLPHESVASTLLILSELNTALTASEASISSSGPLDVLIDATVKDFNLDSSDCSEIMLNLKTEMQF